MPRTLVIVPTYNEARALPVLLEQLAKLSVDVLVVDDDSPDGTGNIAAAFASSFPRIHILNRTAKAGLASAYNDGFRWARGRGYDFIAQMDADGSHRVADLLKLLKRAAEPDQVDLVIGSRWVRGGRVVGWAKWRELLSRAGNLYIRAVLGLPQKDITAGFRVYSRRTFALLEPKTTGYVFQTELTRAVYKAHLRIVEVPITFVERRAGQSKMSGAIFLESLVRVTMWALGK